MHKGKFIVFEGIDGCGKTSHIDKLANKLALLGHKVAIMSNINEDGITGRAIREILKDKDSCISDMRLATLFLSELHYVVKKKNGIEDLLKQGYTVLCSRYHYSTYAYAGSTKEVNSVIDNATYNLVKPDITFYLDVDITTAIKRLNDNREEKDYYENSSKLLIIKGRYSNLLEAKTIDNVIRINNNSDFEKINNTLLELIKKLGE